MLKKNMNKTNLGITLIALVITIIILLIIAGISITVLTGDSGLLVKTGDAKDMTEISQEKEELETEIIKSSKKRGDLDAAKITEKINDNISNIDNVTATNGTFPIKITYKNGHKYQITNQGDIFFLIDAGETAPVNTDTAYTSGNYTAVIPSEFTVSNNNSEKSIENGLVVKDKNDNEWVWIPVSSGDLSAMYTKDSTGWTISGTSGNNAVVTKYKSNSEIISDITRGNPGTTDYREPDVLNNDSYDKNEENRTVAGFSSYTDMATKLNNDYKNMIDSIKKNGGFYVGRYELSNAGTKKNQEPLTNMNWYSLYAKCKTLGNDSAESRMIWGCQWDQICKFISTFGDKVSLSDSSTYGNYSTYDFDMISSEKGNTGSCEAWKTNNIYDLAGNCSEWTQEVESNSYREIRGGCHLDCAAIVPGTIYIVNDVTKVTSRDSFYATRVESYTSTRPVLYINN